MNRSLEADAFSECELEPLANSGMIQPHGALLYIDAATGTFRFASTNLPDFLDDEPYALLGSDGKDWLEQHLPDLAILPSGAGQRIHFFSAIDLGMGELERRSRKNSSGRSPPRPGRCWES